MSVKKTQGIGKGTPGPGRPPGKPNMINRAAREAFQYAFDKLGGADKLCDWAASDVKHLAEFYKLYGRLIPTELVGKDGGDLFKNMATDELKERLKAVMSEPETMRLIN